MQNVFCAASDDQYVYCSVVVANPHETVQFPSKTCPAGAVIAMRTLLVLVSLPAALAIVAQDALYVILSSELIDDVVDMWCGCGA